MELNAEKFVMGLLGSVLVGFTFGTGLFLAKRLIDKKKSTIKENIKDTTSNFGGSFADGREDIPYKMQRHGNIEVPYGVHPKEFMRYAQPVGQNPAMTGTRKFPMPQFPSQTRR